VMAMAEIKEILPPRMKHPHNIDPDLTEAVVHPDEVGAPH
jgi:hypothetical protein